MTDIAKLGFEIDSSPLARAGQAADKAAAQIGKVGDAADQVGKKASAAGKQIGADMGGGLGAAGKQADGVTGSLGKLGAALHGVGKIGKNAAGEIGNISQALGVATGSSGGVALNAVLRGATDGLAAMGGMLGKVAPLAGVAAAGVGTIGAAFLGVQTALATVQDKWSSYEAQLRNTVGSAGAARKAINDLFATSQQSGLGFGATVETFAQIARNAEDIGATTPQILTLTDTVQKLGVVSGTSVGDVSGAMLQLAQSLSAGRLNGDELRVIMERMAPLAKAIADGLGVSVGQLRAMGAAGELTSDKVFAAILKAGDKVEGQFKQMPGTVEREFQKVSDSFSAMLNRMGEAANSSGWIQGILKQTNSLLTFFNGGTALGDKSATSKVNQLERQLALFEKSPEVFPNSGEEIRRLRGEIASMQADVAKEKAEADAAAREESVRVYEGQFRRGIAAAGEVDTLTKSRKELNEQIGKIQQAMDAAGIGKGDAGAGRGGSMVSSSDVQTKSLNEALVSLRQKLLETTDALGKLKQGTDDYRAAVAIGGTGGGIDIASQAQQIAKQQLAQGVAATPASTIGAVINDRVTRAGEEVKALDRQTEAQRKLTGTVDASRAAVRDAEIAQAAYDYRIKTFGTITTPAVEKAVASYTDALRRNKAAQDALGDARAFQGLADQMEVMQAGTKAAADGAYAMRQAEAAVRAAQTNKATPGMGDRQMALFNAGEARQAGTQVDQINRQADATMRQAGAATPGDLRAINLQQGIEDAQRGVAPDARSGVASAMRRQDEAAIAKLLNDQRMDIEAQVQSQQQQLGLIGLQHANLAEQQAMLAKTNELRRQGIDVDSDARAQDLIAAAGRAARADFEAGNTKALTDQARTIEEQIGYQQEQVGLVQLYGQELAVQQAVLAKRNELLRQGVDLNNPEAKKVLDLTAAQARGGYALEEQQRQADAWRSIWETAATDTTGSITAAFMATFDHTKNATDEFRKGMSNVFSRMAEDIMTQALNPLTTAMAQLLKSGGSWLLNAFGGGGGTAAAGDAAGVGTAVAAKGAAFGGGQADFAFAAGGVFTNRVVSSPTMFRFAQGGQVRTGLMGEAGEEAIMPLRRGPDGRLGVSAAGGGGGGGNNISISISVDAGGGTQTKASGDDADNRGRALGEQLSRAVREELLQQMRPGGILAKR